MATYYIDSNATYTANHANNGTASATPWGGAGGVQRALGVVAVGETIYIKSGTTIDLSVLIKVVCTGTLVGALAVDNFVYCFEFAGGVPTNAEAGGGQGYIVYITGKTYYIHVTAGTWTTGAAHCITKENAAVFSNYIEAITVTKPGLSPPAAGTAGNHISIIGTDNDVPWTVGTTQCVLDAASAAAQCILTGAYFSYYKYKNIKLMRATVANWNSGYGRFNIFINVSSTLSANNGFNYLGGNNSFFQCISYLNTGNGFDTEDAGGFGSWYNCCEAVNNTGVGFLTINIAYVQALANCVSSGNSIGVSVGANLIQNCIIDGNKTHGISITGGNDIPIFGNRISNNGTTASHYGILASAASLDVNENYNVFFNNKGGNLSNISTGINSLVAANTTELGYTDVAYKFVFKTGSGTPFIVGETISKTAGWSGTITAITDNGATGVITYLPVSNGMPANNDAFTGGTGGKTAVVNGSFTTTNSAGTENSDYNLTTSAILRNTAIELP
jgi:hypothetical protein